ncbi:Glutamine synthetase [Dictyocoela muelleri]|nr:Glutamine synthetase [Dictyocoela muelleri]
MLRSKALKICLYRQNNTKIQIKNCEFGENVFTHSKMRKFLSKENFKKLQKVFTEDEKIDKNLADEIANAMREWAVQKGITHYTHWFQPLTGATAEKHDAFFDIASDDKEPISSLDGYKLLQQEPDASSFPHGGLRNTFEARGYTAWDPTSPAFIFGDTLCIPSVFISYTGEALDFKTPLIRAVEFLDKTATSVAKIFIPNVSSVSCMLGWEQEYFLIDDVLAMTRSDILITGRTLLGGNCPKNQQLNDHYFGTIPERTLNFMIDVENECRLLGIPIKTRHNEVAPNQYEFAHIYEEINISVDHNTLFMEILKRIAKKHNYKVLLHEKPFRGVNGSGKHCNWSLVTNLGQNLLNPDGDQTDSLIFLTFLINIIRAVYKNEKLIRSSVASASNDLRLGGHEAPPSIISIFIGKTLQDILKNYFGLSKESIKSNKLMNILKKLPMIHRDSTDRNRTSPFAFTGNKFEFRSVGSSANCAQPMTIICTIVADQLSQFYKEITESFDNIDDAMVNSSIKSGPDLKNFNSESSIISRIEIKDKIITVLRRYYEESKNILFDGDGYSNEWIEEAARRGLSNLRYTPETLKLRLMKENIDLFEKSEVFTCNELNSRVKIESDEYFKRILIEGKVLVDIIMNQVIPCSIKYQNILLKNLKMINGAKNREISKLSNDMNNYINRLCVNCREITRLFDLNCDDDNKFDITNRIIEISENLRKDADALELIVDDNIWPITKFRELFFFK